MYVICYFHNRPMLLRSIVLCILEWLVVCVRQSVSGSTGRRAYVDSSTLPLPPLSHNPSRITLFIRCHARSSRSLTPIL